MQSLQIRINLLGEDHPDVASSLHNLADLYFLKQKLDIAEQYSQRALRIALDKLGVDHPDTQMYQRTLQTIYMLQNNPQMYQPILNNFSKQHGSLIEEYLKDKKQKHNKKNKNKSFGNRKKPSVSIITDIENEDFLKNRQFFDHLVPVATLIFSQIGDQVIEQARQGYQQFGKGIIFIEIQNSYEKIGIAYLKYEYCIESAKNAPSEMWESILMYLDIYNPEDYFIVLIVDPLENPTTNTCHHYMLPF